MIHIHMEAIKLGVGNGKVNIAAEDDSIDGMQCIDHPYRNNPGGICAFCLQEKLGKLVSSSFPLPIHASSSSSSSPSFRSNVAPSSSSTSTTRHCASSSSSAVNTVSTTTAVASSSSLSLSVCPIKNENNGKPFHHEYYSRKTRIPFLLAKKKKKKNTVSVSGSATSNNIILKRSKSTATPRRGSSNSLVDADDEYFSPRKRNGFWSFLYLSSKSSAKNLNSKSFRDGNNTATTTAAKLKEKCCSGSSLGRKNDIVIVEEEEENSPNRNSNNNNNTGSSIERKVSRSRSVGCGSRSFSGDFFERISTGFGDCTLRRVESQREGKSKVVSSSSTGIASVNANGDHHHHHCMKERVLRRCGGIFSGFMMTSSSSSNSSNSSYWVSSNSADETVNGGKQGSVSISQNNNRGGRSWGWAFASPMRAFSSKSSSKENHHNKRDIIRDANDKINATPNLSAMPSLLAARG
ncbi:unnamed protein product [Lathyrus oleraceus]